MRRHFPMQLHHTSRGPAPASTVLKLWNNGAKSPSGAGRSWPNWKGGRALSSAPFPVATATSPWCRPPSEAWAPPSVTISRLTSGTWAGCSLALLPFQSADPASRLQFHLDAACAVAPLPQRSNTKPRSRPKLGAWAQNLRIPKQRQAPLFLSHSNSAPMVWCVSSLRRGQMPNKRNLLHFSIWKGMQ